MPGAPGSRSRTSLETFSIFCYLHIHLQFLDFYWRVRNTATIATTTTTQQHKTVPTAAVMMISGAGELNLAKKAQQKRLYCQKTSPASIRRQSCYLYCDSSYVFRSLYISCGNATKSFKLLVWPGHIVLKVLDMNEKSWEADCFPAGVF